MSASSLPAPTPPAPSHAPLEMQVGAEILRLHSRVLDVFSTRSDWSMRLHVDGVAFASRPARNGSVTVQVGRLDPRGGGVAGGSERVKIDLDPAEWERFQSFVARVKEIQALGPEPW